MRHVILATLFLALTSGKRREKKPREEGEAVHSTVKKAAPTLEDLQDESKVEKHQEKVPKKKKKKESIFDIDPTSFGDKNKFKNKK